MANYVKLEWTNSCDLGGIYYQAGFENRLFFDANVGKPDYEEEIEEQYNGDGVLIATFQRLVKIYKFQVFVPEYVADALKLMQLHDTITLTFLDGTYSSSIRNIKADVSFEDLSNDCMALCTISFQQDDAVVKTNCCVNL
jgi:hypothetical protein